MNFWNWSRDHIYSISIGYFVVAAVSAVLTAVLTGSDAAVIAMGFLMAAVGGILGALVAERMGIDERAKHASRD